MALNLNGARLEEVVWLPAAAGTTYTFTAGDMLAWDGTQVLAASDSSLWDTNIATSQRLFKSKFAGVALDSQFADSPARLVAVATYAEVDVTVTSSAFAIGDCVGPAKQSGSLMEAQKLANVTNQVQTAIGYVMRYYSAAVTVARVCLHAARMGAWAHRIGDARVLTLGDGKAYGAADVLTTASAYQLFGGAAEILAFGAVVQTAVSGADLVVNMEIGTHDLDSLTVPTSGSARGVYVEQAISAGHGICTANDTISIEIASGSVGVISTWLIRYRRLD